jgi:hydroxymethylpyrimidine/phosphomethylpyrimidine kinase
LVTPNLPEAARLTGLPIGTEEERVAAARRFTGPITAVLLKGGHGSGNELVDVLVDGDRVERFVHPRKSRGMRGTGCALASAVAARLGSGAPLDEAVRGAVDYVQSEIARSSA